MTNPAVDQNAIDIQQAAPADYPDLYPIFQSAAPDRPEALERGFLLSRYDLASFSTFLDRCTVYHARMGAEAMGFVAFEPVQLPQITGIDWTCPPEVFATLRAASLLWIRMLAVAPHAGRRGIGTTLYRHLFAQHPDADFLTGLYEAPLDNQASRRFHRRLGFQRVGESHQQHAVAPHARVSGIYFRPACSADGETNSQCRSA
jgi:ribosomal protein S18 acetylase RimI-like enzyme